MIMVRNQKAMKYTFKMDPNLCVLNSIINKLSQTEWSHKNDLSHLDKANFNFLHFEITSYFNPIIVIIHLFKS
jgi:hypothetical protein